MQMLQNLSKIMVTLLLSGLCVACSVAKNPLLNPQTIDALKAYYNFALDNTTADCPAYWAKLPNAALRVDLRHRCDQQLQNDYAFFREHRTDILQGASFADLQDPNVWRRYVGVEQ